MLNMAYAVVCWEAGLVCRVPGRVAKGLKIGQNETLASVVTGEIQFGASRPSRLGTRSCVVNAGILELIDLVFRATVVEAKV